MVHRHEHHYSANCKATRHETHHEHLSVQHCATNPNDRPYFQYVQQQVTVLQNSHGISLSHAAAGSLLTTKPYCRLHIQHAYSEHPRTSSNTPALTTNDATPIHEVPTNFALDPAQPKQGADHPSGPQACAMPNQT